MIQPSKFSFASQGNYGIPLSCLQNQTKYNAKVALLTVEQNNDSNNDNKPKVKPQHLTLSIKFLVAKVDVFDYRYYYCWE